MAPFGPNGQDTLSINNFWPRENAPFQIQKGQSYLTSTVRSMQYAKPDPYLSQNDGFIMALFSSKMLLPQAIRPISLKKKIKSIGEWLVVDECHESRIWVLMLHRHNDKSEPYLWQNDGFLKALFLLRNASITIKT